MSEPGRSAAGVLEAESLDGLTVAERRAGDTLRLTTWERLDPAVVCGITTADAGDFGVAHTAAGRLLDAYGGLATGLGFAAVSVPLQIHGAEIVDVEARDTRAARHARAPSGPVTVSLAGRVDGQLIDGPGCLLAATAADCVPLYVWDRTTGSMALLHAGWKGVAAGILPRALARMRAGQPNGAVPTILVHLGPAICGCCYEVDTPVLSSLGFDGDRACLDLRGVLVRQALAAGVDRSALSVSSHCTACGDVPLHSHRGSGGTAGRMAAFLGRRID